MSYFQKNHWYKWMFIGLVILNICTLGIIWSQNGTPIPKFGKSDRVPGDRKHQADMYLLDQLEYNEAQRTAFFDLTQQHMLQMNSIHEGIRKSKQAFYEVLDQADVDSSRVVELSEEVARWQVKLEQRTFYHFKAIRDLGTPEQQEKFDRVILSALKMIGNPPPK